MENKALKILNRLTGIVRHQLCNDCKFHTAQSINIQTQHAVERATELNNRLVRAYLKRRIKH